jgi:hypothetical protein
MWKLTLCFIKPGVPSLAEQLFQKDSAMCSHLFTSGHRVKRFIKSDSRINLAEHTTH